MTDTDTAKTIGDIREVIEKLLTARDAEVALLNGQIAAYHQAAKINRAADLRAIERWINKAGTHRDWPDRQDLMVTLIEDIDALESRIIEDAATIDALEKRAVSADQPVKK